MTQRRTLASAQSASAQCRGREQRHPGCRQQGFGMAAFRDLAKRDVEPLCGA
jgi:hypothetical protein